MKLKTKPENVLEQIALSFNLAPTPLIDTQIAFNAARAIMAAADIGLYEALGKNSKTAEQIAEEIHTHHAATKNLLDCLVGIGYIKWSNGNYSLRSKYYKWLLKEYSSNIIAKLRFQIIEWKWMAHLEEYVRTGKPLEVHSILSKDEWVQYQEGMRDISANAAKELAGKIRLAAHATKMLDIGGSHGLYSIEICKKYSALSSTILELPGAIDQATAIAARYDTTNRIKYKAGNALTDDIGEAEYDLIIINNVVHHFTLEENKMLAQKAARALKPGGMYAIGDSIRPEKPGVGGVTAATFGLYFSLTSASGSWSQKEMHSWQIEAGLKPAKSISLMSLPGWKLSLAYK